MRTEMRLSSDDLHRYELGPMRPGGVPVTFPLREFKVRTSVTLTLTLALPHPSPASP